MRRSARARSVGRRADRCRRPGRSGPGHGYDLDLADAVARAAAPLARTKTDAAVLLHTRGDDAAAEHLRRWGLHSRARTLAQVHFLQDPQWAVHAVAYGAGADVVGGWLDRGGHYADLLGRPVTPGLLRDGPSEFTPP